MWCYVATWFSIKDHESIVYGSRHSFGVVEHCHRLDELSKDIVFPVLQNNSYFGHSECILLSMLADHDEKFRKLALFRIAKARQSQEIASKRQYCLPKMNFGAKNYADLIEWKCENIEDDNSDSEESKCITSYSEPPVLSNLTFEEITKIADSGDIPRQI